MIKAYLYNVCYLCLSHHSLSSPVLIRRTFSVPKLTTTLHFTVSVMPWVFCLSSMLRFYCFIAFHSLIIRLHKFLQNSMLATSQCMSVCCSSTHSPLPVCPHYSGTTNKWYFATMGPLTFSFLFLDLFRHPHCTPCWLGRQSTCGEHCECQYYSCVTPYLDHVCMGKFACNLKRGFSV